MLKYYKKLIALKTAPFFVGLGIHKCLAPIYGGKGHILMLHRVIPNENRTRIHNHLSLEITPEHLESIVQFFIHENYHIISMDKLSEYLKKDQKFVVFTFDDGYKDNMQYAYPIFKKYNCPFTIYICNDFPNLKVFLWWYLLEELIVNNNVIHFKDEDIILNIKLNTILKKEKAFYQIRDAINSGSLKLETLKSLFVQHGIDWESWVIKYALSWNDIVKLGLDKLVTIGAHTVTHRALMSLSKEESYMEMLKSKEEIEVKLGQEVKHLAYPFGSRKEVSEKDKELSGKIGFKSATTTQLGNVFSDHENHLLSLPRITVNSQTSMAVLKLQLAGFYTMIENRFKRVIV